MHDEVIEFVERILHRQKRDYVKRIVREDFDGFPDNEIGRIADGLMVLDKRCLEGIKNDFEMDVRLRSSCYALLVNYYW